MFTKLKLKVLKCQSKQKKVYANDEKKTVSNKGMR